MVARGEINANQTKLVKKVKVMFGSFVKRQKFAFHDGVGPIKGINSEDVNIMQQLDNIKY